MSSSTSVPAPRSGCDDGQPRADRGRAVLHRQQSAGARRDVRGQAAAVVPHGDAQRAVALRRSSIWIACRVGVTKRVRQRLAGDPVGVRADQRRQLRGRPRTSIRGSPAARARRRGRAAPRPGAGLPAASAARRGSCPCPTRPTRARPRRAADGLVQRRRDAPVQRRHEQVRGVQALLGGVVQLPGDALALGLDRQPLARRLLGRRAAAAPRRRRPARRRA